MTEATSMHTRFLTHVLLHLSPVSTPSFHPFFLFLSRHPSFLNFPFHYFILTNPALTSGHGLPEVGACLNWPRCPYVTRCRVQNGDRLGNFPVCKELVTPVWGKAHIGFQHLPEYCRTAPPAYFTGLGMAAPHSPRTIIHIHTHTHTHLIILSPENFHPLSSKIKYTDRVNRKN